MRKLRLGLISVLGIGLAAPLQAQSAGSGYLFGAPDVRFSLRAGYAHANAKSDLFDFVIDNLTLDRSSFSGPSMGGDLSVTVAPRLDLTFSADYSAAVRTSEDRRYSEGANNLPIEQTTSFRRVPLSANAIFYLTPRGRAVGKLAWIPNRVVPWVGAGGGTMWYRFQQEGDFVDYQTLNIFPAKLESSGWAPMVQGLGGVDITLTPRFALTLDGRYMWAKGNLSSDFRSFEEKIDLSGITGSIGFTIRM
jgi:hypothetical protein